MLRRVFDPRRLLLEILWAHPFDSTHRIGKYEGGTEMERGWRHTLVDWFQVQNRLWVSDETAAISEWAADGRAEWVQKEVARWERIRKQQFERCLVPLKGELRLRFLQAKQLRKQMVYVSVRSEGRDWYKLENQLWEQEKVNHYDFYLLNEGKGWKIIRMEEKGADPNNPEDRNICSGSSGPAQHLSGQSRYDRQRAVQYAELWWNSYNPGYRHFEVDCTNFVSQAIHAGGMPMDFSPQRSRGWWYRDGDKSRENWSFSWAVAHSLHAYLASGGKYLQAIKVTNPAELQLGDIICYDWEGDGRWDHNTIVTAIDPAGMPLVNAHTVNSRRRYWDYRDSHAWTEGTKYAFFHIRGG